MKDSRRAKGIQRPVSGQWPSGKVRMGMEHIWKESVHLNSHFSLITTGTNCYDEEIQLSAFDQIILQRKPLSPIDPKKGAFSETTNKRSFSFSQEFLFWSFLIVSMSDFLRDAFQAIFIWSTVVDDKNLLTDLLTIKTKSIQSKWGSKNNETLENPGFCKVLVLVGVSSQWPLQNFGVSENVEVLSGSQMPYKTCWPNCWRSIWLQMLLFGFHNEIVFLCKNYFLSFSWKTLVF